MDDVRSQLAPYLLRGETLEWTGRPDPAKRFARGDLFLVPFSICWFGFMIFWVVAAASSSAPLFSLTGIPFLVIGSYFTVGRFVVKARRKRRTGYGLTAGRALVAVGTGSLSESPLQRIPIGVHRARDGQHVTVIFGRASGWSNGSMYANTGMDFFNMGNGPLGFYDVADVAGLEGALRDTAR